MESQARSRGECMMAIRHSRSDQNITQLSPVAEVTHWRLRR